MSSSIRPPSSHPRRRRQRRSGARNITPRSPEGGGTRVRRFAIDGSPLIELPQRETGRAG
ncbi:hypothetical protein ACIG63_35790 [Streptomyces antimycoticus]|uniref:hypothetical protein n=1 Tax=Streptomyces antimycoticus TaxID=68175 RepID=UPI0033D95423